VSTATLPIAAAGSAPSGVLAAAERVQQLQTLLARVERHPPAGGFASALGAAQTAGAATTATAAGTYLSAVPSTAAYPTTASISSAPPSAGPSAAGDGSAYAPLIEQAAARYGLDPSVLYGLIQQESGFNPSARSGAGALGLTQLMPGTAASLGVTEPLDPAQSIEGGARYLSQLLQQFGGNTADALAAYNAGPGAVQQYGGVPPYPETQQYVTDVLANAASYSQSGETATQPAALDVGAPAISAGSSNGAGTTPSQAAA
jgi:soluble lytic murein transglycosylase-like protein